LATDPDAVWRRPAQSPAEPAVERTPPAKPAYSGPPRSQLPARVIPAPLIQPPPPPRELPPQDHDAIDAEERQAQLITFGLAGVAGVLALLLMLVVFLRAAAG
jgi:hypothetical protein